MPCPWIGLSPRCSNSSTAGSMSTQNPTLDIGEAYAGGEPHVSRADNGHLQRLEASLAHFPPDPSVNLPTPQAQMPLGPGPKGWWGETSSTHWGVGLWTQGFPNRSFGVLRPLSVRSKSLSKLTMVRS